MNSAISHQLPTPDFDAIRAMPAEQAAAPVVDILRTVEAADERIESLTRQVYALRGAAMLIAQQKRIYEFFIDDEWGEPFRSLNRFNKAMFPKAWRYNAEALATIQKLPDVPMEKLVNTSRVNILTLTQVSSNVRSLPDVLEAAQVLTESEFVHKLSVDHNQHLDTRRTLKFTLDAPVAAAIEAVLAEIGETENIPDRSGQLEWLCEDYRQGHELLYLSISENQEHDA